jgi:carboxymethylenebutenolidase
MERFLQGVLRPAGGGGFLALAPDLYHGDVATTVDEAKRLRRQHISAKTGKLISAAVDALRQNKAVRGEQIGLIGFSLGAYLGMGLVAERPADVGAVVVYYGLKKANFKKAQAAFLGHFAETDPFVASKNVADVESRLKAAGRTVAFHVYPGTGHWFCESDQPQAYNAKAAGQAWKRTVSFLKTHL